VISFWWPIKSFPSPNYLSCRWWIFCRSWAGCTRGPHGRIWFGRNQKVSTFISALFSAQFMGSVYWCRGKWQVRLRHIPLTVAFGEIENTTGWLQKCIQFEKKLRPPVNWKIDEIRQQITDMGIAPKIRTSYELLKFSWYFRGYWCQNVSSSIIVSSDISTRPA